MTLVGRSAELAVVDEAIAEARSGVLRVLAIEGEAGIGKTNLLGAVAERSREYGFLVVARACDADLPGSWLLIRAILAGLGDAALRADVETVKTAIDEAWNGRPAVEAATRAANADNGQLIVADRFSGLLRRASDRTPLALLVDDAQWADEASLHCLRYLARSVTASSILIGLTVRTEEAPAGCPIARLIADLRRAQIARQLRLGRFGVADSRRVVEACLTGPAAEPISDLLYQWSEGVPFYLEEGAKLLRENHGLHLIDGMWRLAPLGHQRLPPSIETLFERRLQRLPDATRTLVSQAAILGQRFAVDDLRSLRQQLGESGQNDDLPGVTAALEEARRAGLLTEADDQSGDYRFSHRQVRDVLIRAFPRPRRRAIHQAIVDRFLAAFGGDAEPTAPLARHALAAGRSELGLRWAIRASEAALGRGEPGEAIRLVEEARAAASGPTDRVRLLQIHDAALDVLGHHAARPSILSELAALASALNDRRLAVDVAIRRSTATRETGDLDLARHFAEEGLRQARDLDAPGWELRAALALGQARLNRALGQSFEPAVGEDVDLPGAATAFALGRDLAYALSEPGWEAAAERELGVVEIGHALTQRLEIERRPNPPDDRFGQPEVASHLAAAQAHLERAIDLYSRIDDRRGVMSSLIALAYAYPPTEVRRGSAGRIERIRRLRHRALDTAGEQAAAEASMLYAVHVYARAFGYPDLALERGQEAYQAARALGDRALQFLAAGGMALSHLDLGDRPAVDDWLARAQAIAAAAPTAGRSRDLAVWESLTFATAGDAARAAERGEAAVAAARQSGYPAVLTEVLAKLALGWVLSQSLRGDSLALADLGRLADLFAAEAVRFSQTLTGAIPWEGQALAAQAGLARLRGDWPAARELARAARRSLADRSPTGLQLPVLLVVAQVLQHADGSVEPSAAQNDLRAGLRLVNGRILDEDVRRRWLNAPFVQSAIRLAGDWGVASSGETAVPRRHLPGGLTEREGEVLRLVSTGRTNREIADVLVLSEKTVARHLANIFGKLDVSSRAAATAFALRAGIA